MDSIFLLKLLLTFIVSGVFITFVTVLLEKVNPKIVGFIGGIPNNILISLFFIGLTQTPLVAADATTIIPIVMGIDCLFIVFYAIFSRYNFIFSVFISLLIWFISVAFLVFIKFNSIVLSLFFFVLLFFLSYVMLEHVIKIKTIYNKTYTFSLANTIFRALLSGTIITLVVVITKLSGPLFGGILPSFPAVMVTSILITNRAQGTEFSKSVMKILMISGPVNVVVYATSIRFLYPMYGLILGTIYSFLVALISTYIVYIFIKKKVT